MPTFSSSRCCSRTLLAAGALLTAIWPAGMAGADAPASAVLTTLYSFNPSDTSTQNLIGYQPHSFIAAPGGAFYGLADAGGAGSGGTVLKFQPGGAGFTVLHAFSSSLGPGSSLAVGTDGTLYGTDPGGTSGNGAVYSLAPGSSGYADLHTFTALDMNGVNTDGSLPSGALLPGSSGSVYGEAQLGGANGEGVLYKMSGDGSSFAVLHSFGSGSDGAYPAAGLVAGPDGTLYGVTGFGGSADNGTVFKIAPDGSGYAVLHEFAAGDNGQTTNADGETPTAALTLGSDGLLYGVTSSGGAEGSGVVFQLGTDGTGFSALYAFSGTDNANTNSDGAFPNAALVKDAEGNFYGTTGAGGASGQGTVFLLTAGGVFFNPLCSLGTGSGTNPALTAGPDGSLYGVTADGGASGDGCLFRLDLHRPATHVLWNCTDGRASLWNYHTFDGTFSQNTYGPYPNWTAQTVADGPDTLTRVLWTNTDGRASLWSLDNSSRAFTQNTYGPYSNWTAAGVSVGPDNTTHVLWNCTDGRASLWNNSTSDGTFTQITYGPYSNWTAQAVADGPDDLTRVLWTNTDGRASLWSLDNLTGAFTQNTDGPYPNWTAKSLTVGVDNTTHISWSRADGKMACWDYSTGTGLFTENDYGPYPGWTTAAASDGSDALTRVLWTNTDGRASLWSLNTYTSAFTQNTYGPYPGWTARALSAGQ